MINNNMYLDKEENIHDSIKVAYNINYAKKPTRKQIKQDAIKLANTDNGNDITNKDYLQGNVVINTKKGKQRLFDRTFYKQYNKRIDKTIDDALLTAASNGNVEANQELIRRRTNRVAPYFIPAVLGPVAKIAAANGLFGLAGNVAAKGLNTVGKLMLPSTYTNALGLTSASGLIAPILDTAATSYYTASGIKHGIDLAKDDRPFDAVATMAMNILPFLGMSFKYGNINNKLGQTADATVFKTNLEDLTKLKIKQLSRNPNIRLYLNAQKFRQEAGKKYNKLNTKINTEESTRLHEIHKLSKPFFENYANIDNPDHIVATLPVEEIDEPIKFVSRQIPYDTEIPINGNNIKFKTNIIKDETTGGKLQKFNLNVYGEKTPTFINTAHRNPVLNSLKYDGNAKILKRPGFPTNEEINTYNTYRKSIKALIGDDGEIAGSTNLYGNYISGKPNDLEIVTTKNRFKDLADKITFSQTKQLPLAREGISVINGVKTKTDIQIIDDVNGYATGHLANSMYSVLHPDQMANVHMKFAGRPQMFYPKENGQFYTADELYDQIISKGLMKKVVLVDALKTHKFYTDDVKFNRAISILTNSDSQVIDDVEDALKIIAKSQVGANYKSITELYNIDFNDIKANKKFLEAIGFPEEYATNPKIMKNIAEYYNMQNTVSARVIDTNKLNGATIDDAVKSNYSPRGGTGSGGGGNSVKVSYYRSGVYGSANETDLSGYGNIESVSQYPITNHPESIKNLEDYINVLNNLKVDSKLSQAQITKLKSNTSYNAGSHNVGDVHNRAGYINTSQNAEFIDKELDLPVIMHDKNFISGYVGRYKSEPITYSYKKKGEGNYEFGKRLEKFYSSDNSKGLTRYSYIDKLEQNEISLIETMIANKDYESLRKLGIEVYNGRDLINLEKKIKDISYKNYDRIKKAYDNIYNKSWKIENNKQTGLIVSGGASLVAGIYLGSLRLSGKKNINDEKHKEELYQYYKTHPEERKIIYRQVKRSVISEFEKRLKDETK